MVSKQFLALFLAVAAAWSPVGPLWAQDSKRPIYPKGFEVTIDWQYSCPDGKGCSFNCPGSGGQTTSPSSASFWDQFRSERMQILPVFFMSSLARKLCVVAGSPSQLE